MSDSTGDTPQLGRADGRRRFLRNLGLAGTGMAAAAGAIGSGLTSPASADADGWDDDHRTRRRTTRIHQTVVYHDATPQQLFDLYTNSSSHSAATHPASGDVRWIEPETGRAHETAAVGLVMEGFPLPDGRPGLTAEVIDLAPGRRIVQKWINFAWQLPTKAKPSDRPSMLTLDFRANTVGAEVRLRQTRLPTYDIDLTPSPFKPNGEQAPLSEIVRVHWELLYWQPIRQYLLDQAAVRE